MAPVDPTFVFVASGLMGLFLAVVQNDTRIVPDVELPFGFTLPFLLPFIGAAYYIFITKGLGGIVEQLAGVVFFAAVTGLYMAKLRGKEAEL